MKHNAGRASEACDLWRAAAAWTAALLLAPHAARAGWVQQTSGTTADLKGVHFPDSLNGYAVGIGGVILKTTNGGATWSLTNPYPEDLQGVHFPVDSSTGYAVGLGNRVLKTTDGGANWTDLAPSPGGAHYGVYFFDNLSGYVVGGSGSIIKTTDGGTNWADVTDGTTNTFSNVCFPGDATTGWVVGYGAILKTVNGGTNWTDLGPSNTTTYKGVDFPVNATTGYVSCHQVYKTTDGGSNWTTSTVPWADNIDFADAATGYVVLGWSQLGRIVLKTTDGGATWETQYLPVDAGLADVSAPNALTAYAVGAAGAILKTSDGGGTFLVLHPTANGTTNTFTLTYVCAAGTKWDCVNDQAGNASSGYPATLDAASYVRDDNGANNREMYALADGLIPAGSVVNRIEIRAEVGKTNAPTVVKLSYRRVGTDAGYVDDATADTISTNGCCPVSIRNAWSCLNWTPAHIDALEIGMVEVSGGKPNLGQIYVVVDYTPSGGITDGTNYRSVGTQGGNPDLYSAGNATVAACSSVVSFGGGASLPATIGLGDKLVIGANTYYVWSRDSATQVTLQGTATAAATNAAYAIDRAYTTLQAWEDDRDGDLVGEDRSEVGVCYNDGAFTSALVISGSTTDSTHFMKLTVAEGQRHGGQKNTGARIDAQGGWGGTDAITVEDEYTQVEWLEIKNILDSGDGVYFDDSPAADDSVVSGVFVHSGLQNDNAAFRVGAQDVTVRNCFATGGTTYGVRVLAGAAAAIENCTLVGTTGSGYGVADGVGSTTSVKNTISVNHPAGNDFVLSSTISYFGYNMYQGVTGFDPASYQGNNRSPPADLESLLVSLATEDFHMEANGHTAGGTGLDLSSSFMEDVDGQTRLTPWDIGADDDQNSAPTSGGGSTPRVAVWREVAPY